jgi:deoxyribose-phosphate aldolase
MLSPEKLAKMIDHTNVKPNATQNDIKRLCCEAAEYGFSTACITPVNAAYASQLLKGSGVGVCVVVGFPLGTSKTETKAFETEAAVADGATDIDMVMNVGALKSEQYSMVEEDIKSVVDAADGTPVKVIIETALLSDSEKVKACSIAEKAGAKFIKTSTGVGYPGATVEDVALIKETIGSRMGIKASGGIRTLETALAMVRVGATKIGTSTGDLIIEELLK